MSADDWQSGPLPEGGPGARVEVREHDWESRAYAWDGRGWAWKGHSEQRTGTSTASWRTGDVRWHPEAWRWVQRPGELEEYRKRDAQSIANYRFAMERHGALERIVGEVQQALAGKPEGKCVTEEGRTVALARAGLVDAMDSHGQTVGTALLPLAGICDENGWKP